MIEALQSELGINVIASIIVSALFLALGFAWGKYKERKRKFGRNLEEYDFYPFTVTRENFGEFSLKDFRLGMHYFLKNEDHTAARQLIFIGEQNNVSAQLEPAEQKVYAQLFEKYDGKKVTDDTHEFLENYERIVRLIGKSFPNTGIEILLHNLADPAHSLITLENNVTGRHLRDGTTNLLIDLKRRQLLNEDKIELRAEHRRAKIQMHHNPDQAKRVRNCGRHLYQHRCELHHRQVLQDRSESKRGSKIFFAPICSSMKTFLARTNTPRRSRANGISKTKQFERRISSFRAKRSEVEESRSGALKQFRGIPRLRSE